MNEINLYQSTSLIDGNNSLFSQFTANLARLKKSAFDVTQIVVPSHSMAGWLKDQLATHNGICANIDCVVLSGPVIENTDKQNHPTAERFNFGVNFLIISTVNFRLRLSTSEALCFPPNASTRSIGVNCISSIRIFIASIGSGASTG